MRCPSLAELPPPPPGKTGWPWTEESLQLPDRMPGGSQWPRISIVTPSYNQGEFIEETIRSVLLQGYPDLEYVIMDGGSVDGSVAVIKRYAPWLTDWRSGQDCGQADALNKGFARVSGAVLGYLNSDDVYAPGILQQLGTLFVVQKQVATDFWVAFAVENFGQGAPVIVLPPDVADLAGWVDRKVHLHQPGCFWHRHLFRQAGGFDTRYRYAFDRKLFMHFARLGAPLIRRDEFVAARFRLHKDSKTVTNFAPGQDNGFTWEMQRLSLEFAVCLPPAKREAVIRRDRQHLLDAVQQRLAAADGLRALWVALSDLTGSCPGCLKTRFFLGTIFRLVLRTFSWRVAPSGSGK